MLFNKNTHLVLCGTKEQKGIAPLYALELNNFRTVAILNLFTQEYREPNADEIKRLAPFTDAQAAKLNLLNIESSEQRNKDINDLYDYYELYNDNYYYSLHTFSFGHDTFSIPAGGIHDALDYGRLCKSIFGITHYDNYSYSDRQKISKAIDKELEALKDRGHLFGASAEHCGYYLVAIGD